MSQPFELLELVPPSTSPPPEGSSPVLFNCVDSFNDSLYVGTSDGKIRVYKLVGGTFGSGNGNGRPGTPGTPGGNGPGTPAGNGNGSAGGYGYAGSGGILKTEFVEEVEVAKKGINGIAVIGQIGVIVMLAAGVLSFLSLSTLSPLPSSSFPSLRSVSTFSLDEEELQQASILTARSYYSSRHGNGDGNDSDGGADGTGGAGGVSATRAGEGLSFSLCVVRKRKIWWGRVGKEGVVRLVEDLLIPQDGFVARLRRSHVCLADTEMYALADLTSDHFLPLVGISSAPPPNNDNNDGGNSVVGTQQLVIQRPCIAVVVGGEDENGGEDGGGGGVNGEGAIGEFLIANHNGENGTLGFFMNENGEPCRGTVEWESNTIAVGIESKNIVSLLRNNTIQYHSLGDQKLIQSLPFPPEVKPRSLVTSHTPINIPPVITSSNSSFPLSPTNSTTTSPPQPGSPLPSSGPPLASPDPTSTTGTFSPFAKARFRAMTISTSNPTTLTNPTGSNFFPSLEDPLSLTKLPLSPPTRPTRPSTPTGIRSSRPSTPTRNPTNRPRPNSMASIGSNSSFHKRASSSTGALSLGGGGIGGGNKIPSINVIGGTCKTLVCGRESIWALAEQTVMNQAERLLKKGKVDEALKLVKDPRAADMDTKEGRESLYVTQRAAWHYLSETRFEEATSHFLKSRTDPRLILRLFPDLVGNLTSSPGGSGSGNNGTTTAGGDEVEVFAGVAAIVSEMGILDDIVIGNLARNYAPHIKPDVERAPTTSELRILLNRKGREMLRNYLTEWRRERKKLGRSMGLGGEEGKKVDMAVDTVLTKLLALAQQQTQFQTQNRASENTTDPESEEVEEALSNLMNEPSNDIVISEIEVFFKQQGFYSLLARMFFERGELGEALEVWTRLFENIWRDPQFDETLEDIYQVLITCKDPFLIHKYGLWLVGKDMDLGLKLLLEPSKLSLFDGKDLHREMKIVNPNAAETFLETLVLNKRDFQDAELHIELISRYMDRMEKFLKDPTVGDFYHFLESQYSMSPTSSSTTFLSFMINSLPNRHDEFGNEPSSSSSSSSPRRNPTTTTSTLATSSTSKNQTIPSTIQIPPHELIRSKLILFLYVLSRYDAEKVLERFGGKNENDDDKDGDENDDGNENGGEREEDGKGGMKVLRLERAIVLGRLGKDTEALQLLSLNPLNDLPSSETYCLQLGDPIIHREACALAEAVGMPRPFPPSSSHSHSGGGGRKRGKTMGVGEREGRRKELVRKLVEMGLREEGGGGGDNTGANADGGGGSGGVNKQERQEEDWVEGLALDPDERDLSEGMKGLLDRQANRLDVMDVLPSLPSLTPLSSLTSLISRSIRQTLHNRNEKQLLKSLAMNQNLEMVERTWMGQRKKGGILVKDQNDMEKLGFGVGSIIRGKQKGTGGGGGKKLEKGQFFKVG